MCVCVVLADKDFSPSETLAPYGVHVGECIQELLQGLRGTGARSLHPAAVPLRMYVWSFHEEKKLRATQGVIGKGIKVGNRACSCDLGGTIEGSNHGDGG